MCGITGLFSFKQNTSPDLINMMTKKLIHRGPNYQDIWLKDNIALGHTRLSIHDLSQLGNQPMYSFDKKWIIVLNGEIYNYLAIKSKLLKEKNIVFVSNTDTEVLINSIATWGIRDTLKLCIGMFAFAAFNISEKTLYLARDRFGEKPLYYGMQNKIFGFASELKALKLLATYGWNFSIDRDALTSYMRFSYVPTPYSIYENIQKLEAGAYLEINANANLKLSYYWSTQDVLAKPKFTGLYSDATELLKNKLKQTIRLQMASDVPLGAFLSGGIDSSTIVALMQSESTSKINTFSIGFHEMAFNEANYAKAIAKHLGTNHTELYVTTQDALNLIPQLPTMYDEPFADSSQIPTYFVSQLAKSQVTVSLSGDGGDELFGGYVRYLLAETVHKKIVNNMLMRFLVSNTPIFLAKYGCLYSKRLLHICDRLMKLQTIVRRANNSCFDLYFALCSQLASVDFVKNGNEIAIYKNKKLSDMGSLSYQEWMMHVDANTYLIDDILAKVDRAAMAVSLETRVPFLDHTIYEFACSLPIEYKINKGISKRILRDVLYQFVPQKLIDRPKVGFGIPLGEWLRTGLRSWANDLLNAEKIRHQGYLDEAIIQRYWKEHLSKKHNWDGLLWNILMFQAWLE